MPGLTVGNETYSRATATIDATQPLSQNALKSSGPTDGRHKKANLQLRAKKSMNLLKGEKNLGRGPLLTDLKTGDSFIVDPKETDVVIPIIGITGVGKSKFINTLLGKDNIVRVGHTLDSETQQIQPISCLHSYLPDRRLIILDTPGFNHSHVNDREILRRIAVWLAQSYNAHMKLAGIIYLHEISQEATTVPRVHIKLDMFSKLCGTSATKNIVLATTKWSDVREDDGRRRERLLEHHHWKDMLDSGSVMFRYNGTQDSAQTIINQILAQEPLNAVQIQEEMIDGKKVVAETEAGRSLFHTSGFLEMQKATTARWLILDRIKDLFRRVMGYLEYVPIQPIVLQSG
ncbi:hypothetical protein DXG01_006489 [Tephrocybe rancida]|nr:hypothetical protein DXG01_006489 [Tephrocybe rancida]